MEAFVYGIVAVVFISLDVFFYYAVFHTLYLLAPTTPNLPCINRIRDDVGYDIDTPDDFERLKHRESEAL